MRAIRFTPAAPAFVAFTTALIIAYGLIGTAGSAPPPGAKTTITTLTGGPVTIDTPGEIVPIPLLPAAGTSFTQRAGEVVTTSMEFSYTGNPNQSVHCDVHVSTGLTLGGSDVQLSTISHLQTIFMRGDEWPHMYGVGTDASRTLPAPGADTPRTVLATAFMANSEPESIDGCFGGGSNTPSPDQVMYVSVRISIVRMRV